jgi:hypothetical protein
MDATDARATVDLIPLHCSHIVHADVNENAPRPPAAGSTQRDGLPHDPGGCASGV